MTEGKLVSVKAKYPPHNTQQPGKSSLPGEGNKKLAKLLPSNKVQQVLE
jgi:hypothetical protein